MDFAQARRQMVDCQILPSRVTDERIIAAMETVPREAFVSEEMQGIAYVDEAISLGDGRFVMEPMVVARLLQTLELKSTDVALSIGCGTGYAVGVMAGIVSTVVALEADHGLAGRAGRILSDLDVANAVVVEGSLAEGYPKQAPYDVILFDGAVSDIPPAIADQLAEGGRLAAILAKPGGVGCARLVTRYGGVLSSRDVFDAGTPLLPGFEAEPAFVF